MKEVTDQRYAPSNGYSPDVAFVLIHGGGLGSWVWRRVTPLLEWPTLAVDLPGRGEWIGDLRRLTIDHCAEAIAAEIQARGLRRVVLLAHSLGGVIAPKVAAQMGSRVQHLVFLAATIPAEGRSVLDTFPPRDRWMAGMVLRLRAWGLPMPRDLVCRVIRQTLGHDLDEDTLELLLDRFRTMEVPALLYERVSRYDMPPVPCTYVKLLQDQGALPLPQQTRMARNLGLPDVLTLSGGTQPLRGAPYELARLLNGIADGVAKV